MASLRRPDGIELHYEERGEGPLVMLAPYWSGHPGVYEGFLSDLERDHRVVTWDARGTGESTRAGPYDAETDCRDLEAMLEHVGNAAAVIGVGNGCNVVVEVGARRPDLVDAVLAFGAGPFARVDFEGSEAMIASDSVVAAFLEMLQRDYRGALRTMLSATNDQMSADELRERVDFQASYCPQDAAIGRVQAWLGGYPTESAAALGSRLWVFTSPAVAGDWLPPLEERRRVIHAVTPDAQLEEMPDDSGPVSRPEVVAAAIRRVTEPLRLQSGR
jgi:pimeloyl-ACP methyl ester carboxylesterase